MLCNSDLLIHICASFDLHKVLCSPLSAFFEVLAEFLQFNTTFELFLISIKLVLSPGGSIGNRKDREAFCAVATCQDISAAVPCSDKENMEFWG